MPKYKYQATTTEGATIEGEAEAPDKFTLAKNMRAEGKNLLTATELTGSGWNMDRINAFISRVQLREKIIFARNLATMLSAGLAVSRALQILLKQTKNPKMLGVLRSISGDIEKGVALSAGLEKFTDIFPPVFTSMVKAGEESGGLVEALNTVGGQMEKTYTLKKKVRGAMIYPAIVMVVMVAVGILMMIYIVPGLAGAFKEVGVDLPPLTKLIIGVSEFLQNQLFLSLIIVALMFGGLYMFARTKVGTRSIDWTVTRLPIFGNLVKEFNSALVTRTLSSLISAGVDIVRAISISQDVVSNVYYKGTLENAKNDVQKGVALSQSFIKHPELYPVMVGDMMEVGEETGRLSDMLLKIAVFYEEEVDVATSDMSKLVEPLLMVIIAIFVGIFAYAMITPMYSLMGSI